MINVAHQEQRGDLNRVGKNANRDSRISSLDALTIPHAAVVCIENEHHQV